MDDGRTVPVGEQPSEFERERLRARDQSELELLKATVAFEHASIQPLYLLNGGAIVAALTFVGHSIRGGAAASSVDGHSIRLALGAWALGLIVAFGATVLGYFSQLDFLKEARRKRDSEMAKLRKMDFEAGRQIERATVFGERGQSLRKWAYVFGSLSVIGFLIGAYYALQSLRLD